MLDKPEKSDYFPEEPQTYMLSKVLILVAGMPHINGLDVKHSKSQRRHKRQRVERKESGKIPIS
jgi:hypothetical protein